MGSWAFTALTWACDKQRGLGAAPEGLATARAAPQVRPTAVLARGQFHFPKDSSRVREEDPLTHNVMQPKPPITLLVTSAHSGPHCALAKFVQLWTAEATQEAFGSPRSFQGSASQHRSRWPRVAAQIRDSGPQCSAAIRDPWPPPWAARSAPGITEPRQLRTE